MHPEISIIVPCYNQGQFLNECLTSILNQKFTDWECIIVNDGSPDETDEIAKSWLLKDERFVYISKENEGLSMARNSGLKIAKGNWIQFLDCDDLIEENKLLESSKFFNQGIDIIISGYRYFEGDEGPKSSRIFGRNYFLPEVCLDRSDTIDRLPLFFERNPFVISSPIYKREIFEEIGGFDSRLDALEDWEFNLRCCIKGYSMQHIGYFPKSKTLIRLHQSSLMRQSKKMDINLIRFKNLLETDEKYRDSYKAYLENSRGGHKRSKKDLLFLVIPPIILLLYRQFVEKSVLKK